MMVKCLNETCNYEFENDDLILDGTDIICECPKCETRMEFEISGRILK